jgi:hypothetical protein
MSLNDSIKGSSSTNRHDYAQLAQSAQDEAGNFPGSTQDQIDELSARLDLLIRTHRHDGNTSPLISLNTDIQGLFDVVSDVPTNTPANIFDQIKIYENAGTHRLYWYDNVARAWRYTAGT